MKLASSKDRWTALLLVLLLALGLSACGRDGRYSMTLITEGMHQLEAGEEMEGGLLLLDGQLIVEPLAAIRGSVFVLGGELINRGDIEGDLSMVQGQVELGPQARIGGDLIQAGGELVRAAGSTVQGQIPGNQADATNMLFGGTDSRPSVASIALRAIIQGLLAALAVRWVRRPIERISQALIRHPIASGSVGIFSGLIALLLMVQMAFTVVLIPLSILLGILVLLSVGLAGIFYGFALGQAITEGAGWSLSATISAGLGAALFSLFNDGLQFVPYAGSALQLLLMASGIGALILTRLGLRPFNPPAQRSLI